MILPVRLGIYSLYSIKKVAIFNSSILKILDYYIKQEDFQHDGARQKDGSADTEAIEYAKFILDQMTRKPDLSHDKAGQEKLLWQVF